MVYFEDNIVKKELYIAKTNFLTEEGEEYYSSTSYIHDKELFEDIMKNHHSATNYEIDYSDCILDEEQQLRLDEINKVQEILNCFSAEDIGFIGEYVVNNNINEDIPLQYNPLRYLLVASQVNLEEIQLKMIKK